LEQNHDRPGNAIQLSFQWFPFIDNNDLRMGLEVISIDEHEVAFIEDSVSLVPVK